MEGGGGGGEEREREREREERREREREREKRERERGEREREREREERERERVCVNKHLSMGILSIGNMHAFMCTYDYQNSYLILYYNCHKKTFKCYSTYLSP